MCLCGLGVGLVMFVPSLASWSTVLLHVIPCYVCALTFKIVILWAVHSI